MRVLLKEDPPEKKPRVYIEDNISDDEPDAGAEEEENIGFITTAPLRAGETVMSVQSALLLNPSVVAGSAVGARIRDAAAAARLVVVFGNVDGGCGAAQAVADSALFQSRMIFVCGRRLDFQVLIANLECSRLRG